MSFNFLICPTPHNSLSFSLCLSLRPWLICRIGDLETFAHRHTPQDVVDDDRRCWNTEFTNHSLQLSDVCVATLHQSSCHFVIYIHHGRRWMTRRFNEMEIPFHSVLAHRSTAIVSYESRECHTSPNRWNVDEATQRFLVNHKLCNHKLSFFSRRGFHENYHFVKRNAKMQFA